jgi:hypothetical protein
MLPIDHRARKGLCVKMSYIGSLTGEGTQKSPEFLLARSGTLLLHGADCLVMWALDTHLTEDRVPGRRSHSKVNSACTERPEQCMTLEGQESPPS